MRLAVVPLLAAMSTFPLSAAVWNVTPGSTGSCTAADQNCSTISAAIAAAAAGDTIRVAAGSYAEAITVNKTLTLLGAQAGVDARTRSVPLTEESVVENAPNNVKLWASDVVIDGFVIQNLQNTGLDTVIGASGYHILNNIIRGNTTGIYLANEGTNQAVVEKNLIVDNDSGGNNLSHGMFIAGGGSKNIVVRDNRIGGHFMASMVITGHPGVNDTITVQDNVSVGDGPIAVFHTVNLTVTGNSLRDMAGHGFYIGGNVSTMTIQNNDIINPAPAYAAIRFDDYFGIQDPPPMTPTQPNRAVQITSNNIVGGDYGISLGRTGFTTYLGPLAVQFNRISGQRLAGIDHDEAAATVPAPNNWLGCNAGTGAGCTTIAGTFAATVAATPNLVLEVSASPTALNQYQTSSVTTRMITNSAGADTSALGRVPDRIPVAFGATKGSMNPAGSSLAAGSAASTFRADEGGTGSATATVDGQTVSVSLTITPVADLIVTKTHVGNFVQGAGGSYTLTVRNVGAGSTSGTVTLTDTLPDGLTATALSGSGWSCTLGTLTCTRSDVLTAAGSYPSVTLTVTVAADAPASVTNTASVSGGGEFITTNNSASDPTVIVPPPPRIDVLNPTAICQGGPDFELAVEGANFISGARVEIDGSARPTTFDDGSHLRATITTTDITIAGSASIRVVNPDTSGASNAATLTIDADTGDPVVTAPAPLDILQSMCIAEGGAATGATSAVLAAFLAGGGATDDCTTAPNRLAPQVNGMDADERTYFLPGLTTVAFRYHDNAGNLGTAVSNVTVRLYGDLDRDHAVQAADLVILANYLARNIAPGTSPFTGTLDVADVTGDGKVDALDLVTQANYLVGNFACLPLK